MCEEPEARKYLEYSGTKRRTERLDIVEKRGE